MIFIFKNTQMDDLIYKVLSIFERIFVGNAKKDNQSMLNLSDCFSVNRNTCVFRPLNYRLHAFYSFHRHTDKNNRMPALMKCTGYGVHIFYLFYSIYNSLQMICIFYHNCELNES